MERDDDDEIALKRWWAEAHSNKSSLFLGVRSGILDSVKSLVLFFLVFWSHIYPIVIDFFMNHKQIGLHWTSLA
jgi:hypothetical protein